MAQQGQVTGRHNQTPLQAWVLLSRTRGTSAPPHLCGHYGPCIIYVAQKNWNMNWIKEYAFKFGSGQGTKGGHHMPPKPWGMDGKPSTGPCLSNLTSVNSTVPGPLKSRVSHTPCPWAHLLSPPLGTYHTLLSPHARCANNVNNLRLGSSGNSGLLF